MYWLIKRLKCLEVLFIQAYYMNDDLTKKQRYTKTVNQNDENKIHIHEEIF